MSAESDKFVTSDKALLDGEKAADVEKKILTGQTGFIQITSIEQFMTLAKMAKDTYDAWVEVVNAGMTPERAARVRALRCPATEADDMHSWRALAEVCHGEWGDDAKWSPPWNQLAGMALCESAAKLLGEDHKAPPWN